jgi:putative MATE family efflux protein
MRDMTQGPVLGHLLRMAVPIGIGMLFQTLYVLVDLYFVARLGDAAIAGVGAAATIQFLIMALTQVLGVGGMALIAQACGRKDFADANRVFNQSLSMALLLALATLAIGYTVSGPYMRGLGADAAATAAGIDYLHWFLPGLALQFAMVAQGSALRGTGVAQPTMVVQLITVLLNAALAPVLIAGWGTGYALGVAGAGLATSLSVGAGVLLMAWYFRRLEQVVVVDRQQWRPQWQQWRRILAIGLPPGGEFALMFVYLSVVYWAISHAGTDAQAGFGIGNRVMQAMFLPVIAIAFAAGPVAGQNVGAAQHARVRHTLYAAAGLSSVLMLGMTLVCQWQPAWFVAFFSEDPGALAVGAEYLRIVSWNFVASGLVFTCSGGFQALGNTLPALASSASRLLTFVLPVVLVVRQPEFRLDQVWHLSVASASLQALLSVGLLWREMKRRGAA